jgi:hypothetical protein
VHLGDEIADAVGIRRDPLEIEPEREELVAAGSDETTWGGLATTSSSAADIASTNSGLNTLRPEPRSST